MAAPATTVRGTPLGFYWPDGCVTKIAPSSHPTVSFWEKTVQPFGWDGGDPINTQTMHSGNRVTKHPRCNQEATDVNVVAAYGPNLLAVINSLVNNNQPWTITYPDGTTESFWGWLRSFQPQPFAIGEFPEAEFVIIVSNWDDDNCVMADTTVAAAGGTFC